MKIAYIILAHKNPDQVARLISRLNSDNTYFSIHINKDCDISAYKNSILKDNSPDNIHFIEKRYRPLWGGFNAVRATMDLLESVIPFQPANIIYISGQDYPIRSNDAIRSYLKRHQEQALIEYHPIDLKKINSVDHYYFADWFNYNKSGFDYKKVPLAARLLTKLLPKRTFLTGYTPYIGRQWFVLPLDIAKYVLQQYKTNSKYNDYFKYTLLSAETYVQTLLMNSAYAGRTRNIQTHFADYNAPNPPILQEKDLDRLTKLQRQDALFARKFDTDVDSKILDLIDEQLLQAPQPVQPHLSTAI